MRIAECGLRIEIEIKDIKWIISRIIHDLDMEMENDLRKEDKTDGTE